MSTVCLDRTVVASVCAPRELNPQTRDSMLRLMRHYYRNVKKANFLRDLEQKDHVICLRRLRDAGSGWSNHEHQCPIVGFSTQKVFVREVMGRSIRVLFSGDTIVAREHWNSPSLARAWGRLAMRLIAESSDPLYWLLLTKGYRTFRFLPLFFHRYAPARDLPSDDELDHLRRELMDQMYGSAFDPTTFVVSGAAIDNYALRDGVADIDDARRGDRNIQLFLDLNPGYQVGDELSCIAPLTADNFTAAARRVIGAEYF